jgi:hypothetical protein
MKVFCVFKIFLDGDDNEREELLGVFESKHGCLRVWPNAVEITRKSMGGLQDGVSRNNSRIIIEQMDVDV